mgnify:FL=1
MKTIKRLLIVIYILIGFISYSLGIAVYENLKVDQAVRQFKKDMVLKETITKGDKMTSYYVPRETKEDEEPSFSDEKRRYVGQPGDILVTRESPYPYYRGIHEFVSYYFGGHAALVIENNQVMEIAGFGSGSIWDVITHDGVSDHDFTQTVITVPNYWLDRNHRGESDPAYPYYGSFYRDSFIGLRVKNITKEEKQLAINEAKRLEEINTMYNYLFFLDTKNKYYCTDFISRIYQSINYQRNDKEKLSLNDDGFITSVNDLILSKDTYIFFYKETIGNHEHIYYFE